jgi:hypothetical protein
MSFNYLEIPYSEMPELKESRIRINDEFQDFASLDGYLYIMIDEWNRDYPLPLLPSSIKVLEFICAYQFPLNNLPQNIEVLIFSCEYDEYKFPLENLPPNLYQLEFHSFCRKVIYSIPLQFIPESVKILRLNNVIRQQSYNLPIKLKELRLSSNTFTDEIVIYPLELEQLYLKNNSRIIRQEDLENLENLEKLDKYFNLINLPLSIRMLELPNIKISNLECILKRLIHLKELFIPNDFYNAILEYPPNLEKLYIIGNYKHKLENLPSSLKIISLGWYDNSLEAVANSNIENINLDENKNLSIIGYLPKSLKKLTIIQTHSELYKIKNKYPLLEINILPDYDYQEAYIDSMRGEF